MNNTGPLNFCNSTISYSRVATHQVPVGNVTIGGDKAIKLQSMTTTDTNNVDATVAQVKRIFDAGADLVRITAQGVKEAEKLRLIKAQLVDDGYTKPLVADIHFNPKAAVVAAEYVEKVRINPGNYVDSKRFKQLEYTDEEYSQELEKIRANLKPLLSVCKKHGTAIRIGANHGSLSDRIMSRYGDTPMGLVMSLVEFLRICREEGFFNVVLSIKASNTRVMVQSCRLLVSMMRDEGFVIPLHLGVTEAGEGEDGRIKSAVGIGALLMDGIGDTVRVSLTEDPECEIPVAKAIVDYCSADASIESTCNFQVDPFSYKRRETDAVCSVGGSNPPVVVADLRGGLQVDNYPDYVIVDQFVKTIPSNCGQIVPLQCWDASLEGLAWPLLTVEEYQRSNPKNSQCFLLVDADELDVSGITQLSAETLVLFVYSSRRDFRKQRSFVFRLIKAGIKHPVVFMNEYDEPAVGDLQIKAACDLGSVMIDGLCDGILLRNSHGTVRAAVELSYSLLQASRLRMSKTEYISCPSCGRTLFDIQDTVKRIKTQTSHLKNLKIAVMGCIVNGPGEMADADYGYVGSGPGKVSLYKEQEVIKRNVRSDEALGVLIEMIKEHGDWRDA